MQKINLDKAEISLCKTSQSTTCKKIYLEWLRVISAFLVIFNHSGLRGFNLYTVTTETNSFWLSIIMNSICKVAVPVFLMISGVTLLHKEESYKTLFQKRILKYIFIILLFGTLQYLRYFRTGKVAFSFRAWFSSIFCKPVLETYWFLYLYLGFLLLVPFLRKAVKTMQEKDYFYLYVLNIISCTFGFLGYFTGFYINGHIFQLVNILIYPLLGFGIDKYGYMIPKKFYFLSFVMPVAISTLGAKFYMLLFPDQIGVIGNILQQFTPLIACGLFGLAKLFVKDNFDNIIKTRIVTAISSTVFGVYLIEDIVRNQVDKLFAIFKLDNIPNDFVSGILFTLLSFVICVGVIYIIKLIPYVKKII